MKLLYWTVPLGLLVACGESAEPIVESTPSEDSTPTVVIAGQIANPVGDSIKISGFAETITYAPINYGAAAINADGSFHIEFPLEASADARFLYAEEHTSVYLVPGDSVYLTMDTESYDESITWSGAGDMSIACKYLAAQYLVNENQDVNVFTLTPERFNSYTDSVLAASTGALHTQMSGAGEAGQSFAEQQATELQYRSYRDRENYVNYAKYYQGLEEVIVPDDFYAYREGVSMSDESLMSTPAYLLWVQTRIDAMVNEQYEDGMDWSSLSIKVGSENLEGKVKEHYLTDKVYGIARRSGLSEKAPGIIEEYRALYPESEWLVKMDEKMAEWDVLKPGNPAPSFSGKTVDGADVSLADFEGSVVYVDVWATWCGPCRGEIPHLKELEHAMANENVTFVSISVDDDHDAWRTMVAEEELGGVQIIQDGGWDAQITGAYNISGIPRFIVIGPDGMIVNASAPRPSSGEEIQNLLRESLPEPALAAK